MRNVAEGALDYVAGSRRRVPRLPVDISKAENSGHLDELARCRQQTALKLIYVNDQYDSRTGYQSADETLFKIHELRIITEWMNPG